MEKQDNKLKNVFHKITFRNKFSSERNYNITLIVTFIIGVSLIFCTYAWFYASLDVKISFFNMSVSNESGLFISLDGIDYKSEIVISKDTLINELKNKYPNHTNQWPMHGLYAVSSNGINNPNNDKFQMFANTKLEYIIGSPRRVVTTKFSNEDNPNDSNIYVAFDVFLKNVSGSPMSDNLYFYKGTSVFFERAEDFNDSDGIVNSMRVGIVKIGSTSSKSDINTIQNLKCNNACEMVIYEPNSERHSKESAYRLERHNIKIVDGVKSPTYAVINEGIELEPTNGQEGTNIPLDAEHFALQKTINNFDKPIFQIPNGVTKARIYVWIEGQDVDSLESVNQGADYAININLYKDLAGYYYYND